MGGVFQCRFVDEQDVGNHPGDHRAGQIARDLDGDALGDGLSLAARGLARQRLGHGRIKRRLDADDLDIGLNGFGGHGDPGRQPAAADRHHQNLQVRKVVQEFQPHGALAADDLFVVVGVDEGLTFPIRLLKGRIAGFRQALARHHHLGTQGLGAPDLGERRRFRHVDGRRHAELAGMIGDALGVVAGRCGDDA